MWRTFFEHNLLATTFVWGSISVHPFSKPSISDYFHADGESLISSLMEFKNMKGAESSNWESKNRKKNPS